MMFSEDLFLIVENPDKTYTGRHWSGSKSRSPTNWTGVKSNAPETLFACMDPEHFFSQDGQLEWLLSHNQDIESLALNITQPESFAKKHAVVLHTWPNTKVPDWFLVLCTDNKAQSRNNLSWDCMCEMIQKSYSQTTVCLFKNNRWQIVLDLKQKMFAPFKEIMIATFMANNYKTYQKENDRWVDVVEDCISDILIECSILVSPDDISNACQWYMQQPPSVKKRVFPQSIKDLRVFLSLCPEISAQQTKESLLKSITLSNREKTRKM